MPAGFPSLKVDFSSLRSAPDTLPEGWGFTPLAEPQRIDRQSWPEGTRPWVSILVLAYQHAAFIREAIESLLMQETTFPVEIVVSDDASVDGTADIIREYQREHPQLFHLLLQTENLYSQNRRCFPLLYQAARGYYIAMCEGDDYWTHPLKLEIQSRLHTAYPNVVISGHPMYNLQDGVQCLNRTGAYLRPDDGESEIRFAQRRQIFQETIFPSTQSVFYRKMPLVFSEGYNQLVAEDRYVFCCVCNEGDFMFIPEPMAVYRIHSGGVYSSRSNGVWRIECSLKSCITAIPYLSPRWGACMGVHLSIQGLELIREGKNIGDWNAVKAGVKTYLSSYGYAFKGLRDGPKAWGDVMSSVGLILWQPLRYGSYFIRNLARSR